MDYKERYRIEREEEARLDARENIARRRMKAQDKHVEKMLDRQTYVNLHGPQDAFLLTAAKWTIGGLVFGIIAVIGGCSEGDTFGAAIGNFFVSLIIGAAIGVTRGLMIVKSVR